MSHVVIGIDPGPVESGVVAWDAVNERVVCADTYSNELLRNVLLLVQDDPLREAMCDCEQVVIEKLVSYGMRVGESTFQTAYWVGRIVEIISHLPRQSVLVSRPDVKLALCFTARATDADVRDALITRFGPKGTKSNPGRLYGVKGHCWSALAVAVSLPAVEEFRARKGGA